MAKSFWTVVVSKYSFTIYILIYAPLLLYGVNLVNKTINVTGASQEKST